MAFWRAVNIVRVCKHSPNPKGPLPWMPGGLLSFTQPAPSHTKLLSEGLHSCLKCSSVFAYSAHTILFSLHSQQFVNIPCLFSVIDSMKWFHRGKEGRGVMRKKRGVVKMVVFFSTGTMAVCHSSFIIEIGVYLLQAWVECFCFSSDY